MADIKIKKLYRRVNILNKQYYTFEVRTINITEKDGVTTIRSNCREVPCSYNYAKSKAERQRKLINIIDGLRK